MTTSIFMFNHPPWMFSFLNRRQAWFRPSLVIPPYQFSQYLMQATLGISVKIQWLKLSTAWIMWFLICSLLWSLLRCIALPQLLFHPYWMSLPFGSSISLPIRSEILIVLLLESKIYWHILHYADENIFSHSSPLPYLYSKWKYQSHWWFLIFTPWRGPKGPVVASPYLHGNREASSESKFPGDLVIFEVRFATTTS